MQRIGKLCFAVGCLLVVASLTVFLTVHISVERAKSRNLDVVQTISTLLPPLQPGVKDTFSNMNMPVLEIGGEDYVALVEIPALGLTLPVANEWDKVKVLTGPRRFDGTVYDGSLIVGGSDQPGQFSGFSYLEPGNAVTVTDMTGSVFYYVIDRIDRSSTASGEALETGEADLTLFVRNAYNLDYIQIRCVPGKS